MKSRKLFYVLALSAGLFTAGSAFKLGTGWHRDSVQASAVVNQVRQSLERQSGALREAMALQEDAGERRSHDKKHAFASVLLGMQAAAVANGVKHIQVTAGHVSGQRDMALDTLFQPLPNTGNEIVVGQLTIKGQYKDYASFKRYLDAVTDMSASIRRMNVSDSAFDLDVRIYAVK